MICGAAQRISNPIVHPRSARENSDRFRWRHDGYVSHDYARKEPVMAAHEPERPERDLDDLMPDEEDQPEGDQDRDDESDPEDPAVQQGGREGGQAGQSRAQ